MDQLVDCKIIKTIRYFFVALGENKTIEKNSNESRKEFPFPLKNRFHNHEAKLQLHSYIYAKQIVI